MPRHSFAFPPDVRQAVRDHVERAVRSVDPARYQQESAYIAALARALEGKAYDGSKGHVSFSSTIVTDRGRNASESWSGADLAITADVSDGNKHVRKAILAQAKRGELNKIRGQDAKRLRRQVRKMARLTRAPKILDIQVRRAGASVGAYSGQVYLRRRVPTRYDLGDYFVRRVLTTADGDTRKKFVEGVQESGLTTLNVKARRAP